MAKASALSTQTLTPSDSLGEWDAFVERSPQGCIFCRSWWLEAVCRDSFKILVVRRGRDIVAGMPLTFSRKFIWTGLTMPILTQTLGVLLAPDEATKYVTRLSNEMTTMRFLIEAIPRTDVFRVNMHRSLTNWLPFYWAGYSQTTRYTYVIDDLSDLEKARGDMNPHERNKLKKAAKSGIRVEETDDIGLLIEFHRKAFTRQDRTSPFPEEGIRRVDAACKQHDARTILVTRDGGDRVHSALYLVHDGRCMYKLLSGAEPELRSSGAHPLAVWRSFELAHERRLSYDCEGSMVESIEPFNRGLGAVQRPYFEITKYNSLAARAVLALRDALAARRERRRLRFQRRKRYNG